MTVTDYLVSDRPLAQFSKPTIVEVWAPSCAPCRAMKPNLEATAADFREEVDLVVVDASRQADAVRQLGVMGTPTLIGVRDGIELFRTTGRRNAEELAALFASTVDGSTRGKPGVARADRLIRVSAGALLVLVGLVSGPTWLLVAIGGVVAASSISDLLTAVRFRA